ncbi:hypothetical protein GCM10027085_59690 [Spirosoma aerophilum]
MGVFHTKVREPNKIRPTIRTMPDNQLRHGLATSHKQTTMKLKTQATGKVIMTMLADQCSIDKLYSSQ